MTLMQAQDELREEKIQHAVRKLKDALALPRSDAWRYHDIEAYAETLLSELVSFQSAPIGFDGVSDEEIKAAAQERNVLKGLPAEGVWDEAFFSCFVWLKKRLGNRESLPQIDLPNDEWELFGIADDAFDRMFPLSKEDTSDEARMHRRLWTQGFCVAARRLRRRGTVTLLDGPESAKDTKR